MNPLIENLASMNKIHVGKKPLAVTLAVVFCAMMPFAMPPSFGHGVGSETLPPVMLGGRNVTLSISETQLTPDSSQSSKIVAIMLYETNTKKQVRDVTFHVAASKDGKLLFEDEFKRNNGDLDLNIITTNDDSVKIQEEYGADWLGQIVGSQSNFAIVTGPIFGTGGLYHFKVQILTADSYSKLNPPLTYDASISIPDTTTYRVSDENANEQDVKIITYYDQISNFQYFQNSTIKFDMPFDWSEQNINQVSVVHEEIQFSKSFGSMLHPKYLVRVNGVQLDDRSVIIDDYSTQDRIVHIIVNQNELKKLGRTIEGNSIQFVFQPADENAPLLSYTQNSQYSVQLAYDPHPLTAGSDAKFSFEIKNLSQNKTASVFYSMSIQQFGKELFKKSGTSSASQSNQITTTIPEGVSGPIQIRFDNIGGNAYASAEFPLSIYDKEQSQEFPIRLFSYSSNDAAKTPGPYQVDLTWFPTNLQIDEDSEFVFTIRNVGTGDPAPNTPYRFVILQDGNEIFSKSGYTSSGGDYVDYSFAKGQEGSYQIRVENIGNSSQLVETTVTVTPEFPMGLLIALAGSFAVLFAFRPKGLLGFLKSSTI